MQTVKSQELYSQALNYIPGGVNSPVRAFRSVGGTPLFMKHGSGSKMTDVDDNTYIDYCMSWGPLLLGHAEPAVVKAVISAAENGTSFGTPSPFEVEMASMICERFSTIDKVRFVNSGTEAVMTAVRLARGFTGRDKIVKFDGCYHGHADHLLVAAGSGLATFGNPDSAGVTSSNAKDTLIAPFNDLEYLEKLFEASGNEIAAIITEPLPLNHAMIPPKDGYLKALRKLCDDYGALLIFDEVITGLRLSRGGAQQYYGVDADLTTLGKVIGGGLPVGACGGRADIMNMLAPDGPVYQAGTLSGNPLAMSAGAAMMKRIDEIDAYPRLEKTGSYFEQKITEAISPYPGKVKLLRKGSIFSFYFTDKDRIESLADVKSCDMKKFASFHSEMLQKGIYFSPSGFEVGFVSTAHSEEDINKTAEAAEESLKKVLG